MKQFTKQFFLLFLSLTLLLAACGALPAAFARRPPAGETEAAAAPETCAQAFFRQIMTRLSMLCELLRRLFGTDETEDAGGTDVLRDVTVDKSRYLPGEQPQVSVTLLSGEDMSAKLTVRAIHFAETVFKETVPVELTAGEPATETFTLTLPETDFTGYAVEAYVRQGETTLDAAMTAVEVASDWSRFPRYGYLTDYTAKSPEALNAVIDRLNRFHITGLFFYDVMDRHDRPLAGTVEAPDAVWQTLARQNASFSSVKGLIDRGHARGMNAYLYNLLFGAYQDYAAQGVDPAWGLYRDKEATRQDYHGELPGDWETQRIYLFNPANRSWQDHYLKVTKDVLEAFGYDGLQADSLGGRGALYDAEGNEVNLAEAYVPLLNRIHDELGTKVIFNPVSGYGSDEMLSRTDYDIMYEEFWESDGKEYRDLRDEVYRLREKMTDDKGVVLAAYMDRGSFADAFNPAGVLLTDATLMASGAAHLELGDTGMLKSEYYPGSTLTVDGTLNAALERYYSFSVAYENVLRDAAFRPTDRQTKVNFLTVKDAPKKNAVWCVNRENGNGDMVLNFINFTGLDRLEWMDADGTQPMPEKRTDLHVLQYVEEYPSRVYLASPDDSGIMEEIPFAQGRDLKGKYVTFILPELSIWSMVYVVR